MKPIKLELPEQRLCACVKRGETLELGAADEIAADVIRRLVLGLPFDKKTGLVATIASFFEDSEASIGARTPVGISIQSGIIQGRLDLAAAVREDGGPICPLEFHGCRFEGGFSGRHGNFARLSFRNCTFQDHPDLLDSVSGRPLPTIDLSGASIASDLDMAGVKPGGVERDREDPQAQGNYLWIKAAGARIGGKLDLANSHLRAPGTPEQAVEDLSGALDPPPADAASLGDPALPSEDPRDALDFSLADIAGDFLFTKGSRARGRIKGRGAHLRGDAWLSGALLDGVGGQALMLQAARIGGRLMLDSRYDGSAGGGDYRWFTARGEIDLRQLHLGGELVIRNANLDPSDDVRPSEPLDADGGPATAKKICLCLASARLASSAVIGCRPGVKLRVQGHVQLRHLEVKGALTIENISLGAERASSGEATIDARSLVAGALMIEGIGSLAGKGESGEELSLSVDLADAEVQKLEVRESHLSGFFKASSLCAAGDVVLHARIGEKVDLEGATIGGSLDISRLCIQGERGRLSLVDGGIGQVLRLACRDDDDRAGGPEGQAQPFLASEFCVHGTVDLRGLTCDSLDDGGGRFWAGGACLEMNHFVYRQAILASRRSAPSAGTRERLRNWLHKRAVQFWPSGLALPRPWRGREIDQEPWQHRRDWVYRQFRPALALPRPSRYKIRGEHDYRPQPFEQAIRVARAEGREDFAINFEMLKHSIEWRLFNMRSRWWLAIIAVVAGAGWLIHKGGTVVPTLLAAFATLAMMPLTPLIWRLLGKELPWWLRRGLRELLFYVPAFVLYRFDGWNLRPLHFAVAFLIFLGIRYISVLSHRLVRVGFGYLRRPVNAVGTLIVAFVLGWWGVHLANERHMLVVDAEPVATIAAPEGHQGEEHILMGSQDAAGVKGFVRDVSCLPTVSESLYALDVLIPLIDLREESRCEIRRLTEPPGPRRHGVAELGGRVLPARGVRRYSMPGDRPPRSRDIHGLRDLIDAVPAMTINYNGFWAVMKALYAIAGWFIVSLSILTFAQVNRTHAESFTERK